MISGINILNFYRELTTDTRFIAELLVEFMDESETSKVTIDGKKETVNFFTDGTTLISNSYDYLVYRSKNERIKVLNGIELTISKTSSEEQQRLFLNQLLANIDFYLLTLEGWSEYPFFASDLKKLKEDVSNKFSYLIASKANKNQTESSFISEYGTPKIAWNAGVASLATLFYDLMYEYKMRDGKPYLSDTADIVIPFIHANFCNENGEEFELDTLKKYILKSGEGKRVKEAKNNRVIVRKPSGEK